MRASSYSSSSASWLVKKSTWWMGESTDRSTPQAFMKRSARSISSAIASKRRPSALVARNSRFHECTCDRSAKPPLVKARSRFSVEADWW